MVWFDVEETVVWESYYIVKRIMFWSDELLF